MIFLIGYLIIGFLFAFAYALNEYENWCNRNENDPHDIEMAKYFIEKNDIIIAKLALLFLWIFLIPMAIVIFCSSWLWSHLLVCFAKGEKT